MFTIRQFPFDVGGQASAALAEGGSDWPVIYLINGKDELYVGETTSFERRFQEHLNNRGSRFAGMTQIRFAYDGTENKSAVLDYESSLIRLFAADGRFPHVLNAAPGQSQDHDYYRRPLYGAKIATLWDQLHGLRLTRHDYWSVRNSALYKFSPLTTLTSEQREVVRDTLEDFLDTLSSGARGGALLSGGAGTGKSLLAVKIVDLLLNSRQYMDAWKRSAGVYGNDWRRLLSKIDAYQAVHGPLRIAYIAPQQSFNADMSRVFGKMPWAGGQHLVHNCSSIVTRYPSLQEPFDIIIVDEAHRLKHREGMANDIGIFDENCRRLGLPSGATQLDVILERARYSCLLYDPGQTVKSSDITPDELSRSLHRLGHPLLRRALNLQLRCLGGGDYVRFLEDILSGNPSPHPFRDYDFRVFDDVGAMLSEIRRRDGEWGLCRTLAGFAWPWETKKYIHDNKARLTAMGGPNRGKNAANLLRLGQCDIAIGRERLVWNIRSKGWVTSPGAPDEIGCIHTSQGYDLNYCGVILGPDIRYDRTTGSIVFHPESFCDPFYRQNRRRISDAEIRTYIRNAYRTLMLRGIYGCFVYAVDDDLRAYLKQCVAGIREASPLAPETVTAPTLDEVQGHTAPIEGNPDQWFGGRVAELRKARGLSQEELAFRAGINRSYMGVIERGEKSPSLDTIKKVAKGLGMTIRELFLSGPGKS